jgi:dephospho-CoA kinase
VLRIALTGGIGTGKSYVRARFEKLGAPTIDSDVLAREVVAPGTSGLADVVRRFGDGVLDPNGALDRKLLASIVFADDAARRDLEAIVHPRIRAAIDRWFLSLNDTVRVAIADIPLLYETGREGEFDAVIVVAADPETQVQRVMHRDGLSETDARARLAAQLPIGEKVGRADYVIRTDGTHADTDRQVKDIHALLLERPPTTNH